jgi:hypothetical protein
VQNGKKLVGCLTAACALGALAASSASAALPELGRCLSVEKTLEGKKDSYHGVYSNRNCTKVNPKHKGKYEWTPGPGAGNTIKAELEEPTLETVGGAKVQCGHATLNGGEYTGAKTEKFSSVLFTYCLNDIEAACQTTPTNPAFIEDTNSVEGELGMIAKSPKPTAGWDLKGVKLVYYCGNNDEPSNFQVVEGSVIGAVARGKYSNLNQMSELTQVAFTQASGKQLPEMFEGGTASTLSTTTIDTGVPKSEQTGLSTVESGHGGEALEIRTEGEPPTT